MTGSTAGIEFHHGLIDVGSDGSRFFGRRYRIPWEQLLDIAFQENGKAPGDTAISIQWASPRRMGGVGREGLLIAELLRPRSKLKYPSIVEFAGTEGLRRVTLSGPVPKQGGNDRTWSADYVKVIIKGLHECRPTLTRGQIVDDLRLAAGAAQFEEDVDLADIVAAR